MSILSIIWDGFFGAIFYGFLAYLAGLGLLFFLRSQGWLKRTTSAGKTAVVTYWIFIPVLCSWLIALLVALSAAENSAKASASAGIVELRKQTYPQFKAYVAQEITPKLSAVQLPSNEVIVEQFTEKTGTSWISGKLLVWLLEIAEEEAEENLADQTGLRKESIHALRLMNAGTMDALYDEGIKKLENTADGLIGKLFLPYYVFIIGGFVFLLIFPFVEIIRANRINHHPDKHA